MGSVPSPRVRTLVDLDPFPGGDYVVYWMVAYRRTRWNFALQRAVDWARELGKPLVVLEAIRCDYPWASARFHRFVLDGMVDNAARFTSAGVTYLPYVEPEAGAGSGLLEALASRASVVVTDDFPTFTPRRVVESASRKIDKRLEAIDSNGLFPCRSTDRVFPTAYAFRRFLQKELITHLEMRPRANPLARLRLPALAGLPSAARRWPAAAQTLLGGDPAALRRLPIDQQVGPTKLRGGPKAARQAWRRFLDHGLERYGEDRNHPDEHGTSRLSPYLHFGHLSSHQVFWELADRYDWTADQVASKASGSRSGWWGLDEAVEGFLDQIVTWRELGFNACVHLDRYDEYESLPEWAQQTLARHADDRRDPVYDLETFERASTHDRLWNAAQRQLSQDGEMHNYLRMLWGKKILHWSRSPREALDIMIELNNKYALDGRNPNSYSGIFWVLGRYDRAWGPERPIFGKVRYMTSENTARKLRLKQYLQRFDAVDSPAKLF